ncbi:hypothetical protein Mapa_013842 [Marchantia paleacea]|nr:hypothetical protein Mapa_013842 [Marchantia paleacea]
MQMGKRQKWSMVKTTSASALSEQSKIQFLVDDARKGTKDHQQIYPRQHSITKSACS